MKWVASVLFLVLLVAGCTTRSSARRQAQEAYLNGQQQARNQMQQTLTPSVIVAGNVQNHNNPWGEI